PYEELAVHAPSGLGARLLRDEALEAGLDPFAVPAGAGDRLAMLLERVDELSLRRHDVAADPPALLARVVERIDRLKAEGITAREVERWASALPEADEEQRARAEHERERAALYAAHDRLAAEQGVLDEGELVLRAGALLAGGPHVRARVGARVRHLLVDDAQDLPFAAMRLVELLAAGTAGGAGEGNLWLAANDDAATARLRAAATRNVEDLRVAHPRLTEIVLEASQRCPAAVARAAVAVVAPVQPRLGLPLEGGGAGELRFWRCANERAQAQAVAGEAERLVRAGTPPERIGVLVRSVRREGQALRLAFEQRGMAVHLVGAADLFARAEVRDVLAWLRLLTDPADAGAAVRALARPPIELRSVDLARCVQIARRRRLDMVGALVAATESPQLPPEARERILAFLRLHRSASAALDTGRPDLFVHRLIEHLGLRRQQLFAAHADVVERLVNLAHLAELAAAHVRRSPQATPREFARYLAAVSGAGLGEEEAGPTAQPRAGARGVRLAAMDATAPLELDHVFVVGLHAARMPGARDAPVEAIPDELLPAGLPPDDRAAHEARMRRLLHVAMTRACEGVVLAFAQRSERGATQPPSPFAEEARATLDAAWEDRDEELFGPAETVHAAFTSLRDDLLADVARVGKSLGELRFDTDLDVSHAVVRYLELVKLGALLERPADQSLPEALAAVNERLAGAVTAQQREILLSSGLDDALLGAEQERRARAATAAARSEPSLEAFLPRKGEGLALSASDIETYRTCPLKYKFARVFRIPQEPTLNQRFGILVHQVLERYHRHGSPPTRTLDELLGLLEAGWRRAGFGDSEQERQLRAKADAALRRYFERTRGEPGEPVWFERSFAFRMGPHTLRGRVDRVDRLPGGGYELIDYKTGRPLSATALREDVQLSLYAVGAREAWRLEAADQAYLYVLDDAKVRVPREEIDPDWIEETVMTVAEGIQGQGFEPTPSYAACSICDFRIACPAAER
ncbi:MAG TPA: ATP-dependent DNA helicase, partial [Solirubrobacteraceae bacterium]|nr:ATP-dependent DNA helicase [Solirubrobacteraceae bacterium]